jgi:anaerobic selenocysteine-containing dehydrogenase
MPEDVAGEVQRLLASPEMGEPGPGAGFTHLLSTRRMNQVMNSQGNTLPTTLRRAPHNPAYLHPGELEALDLAPGDPVHITSARSTIAAIVQPDDRMRRGVVSIAHAWGRLPGTPGPGVNVNLLTRCDSGVEPINAMPRMSAVPVTITKEPQP